MADVDREAPTLVTCLSPLCDGGTVFETLPAGRYRMLKCEFCAGSGVMSAAQAAAYERARRATVGR